MNLLGLSFLLFISKWSDGNGCWYQLRVTAVNETRFLIFQKLFYQRDKDLTKSKFFQN